MRLIEYLKMADVPNAGKFLELPDIERFTFGEKYSVRTLVGVVFEFSDLEDILAVIRSEFSAYPNRRAQVTIQTRSKQGLGAASSRELIVYSTDPALSITRQWEPHQSNKPIDEQIDSIRSAVTMYNLTQTWEQFHKGNL